MKKISPRILLLLAGASLLLTFALQLLSLWIEGTPLRFDVITLLVLPGAFFVMLLLYALALPKLLDYLERRNLLRTPFRRRWVEYTGLFLIVLFHTDLSDALLEGVPYDVIDLAATLVLAPLTGAVLAWVERRDGEGKPATAEGE